MHSVKNIRFGNVYVFVLEIEMIMASST
jgi:hypothetical protein